LFCSAICPGAAAGYIVFVIALGATTLVLLLPRATFTPVLPLLLLVFLSSVTSAFKVQFPIASGSNMSVSYVVDIASLILRGPHATMIVGAASGWSQTTLNSQTPNPLYRTLFNMSILVLTVQASDRSTNASADRWTPAPGHSRLQSPAWRSPTFSSTPSRSPSRSRCRRIRTRGASGRPTSLELAELPLGAGAAAAIILVGESSGYSLTLLLAIPVLYLTWKMYRAGLESEARQGAILEAANDAIITMDQQLNIREFNPAAERMFGYKRLDILGRNVALLLPP
jgi:PAS domain-containing protein